MNRGHRCDALTVILFFQFFAHFPFTVLKTVSFPEEFFFFLFWVPGRYGLINTLLSSSHHFANKHAPPPLLPSFYSHDKRKIKRMQRFFPFFSAKPLYFLLERKRICCVWEGGDNKERKIFENSNLLRLPSVSNELQTWVICQNIGRGRQLRMKRRQGNVCSAIFGVVSRDG